MCFFLRSQDTRGERERINIKSASGPDDRAFQPAARVGRDRLPGFFKGHENQQFITVRVLSFFGKSFPIER